MKSDGHGLGYSDSDYYDSIDEGWDLEPIARSIPIEPVRTVEETKAQFLAIVVPSLGPCDCLVCKHKGKH